MKSKTRKAAGKASLDPLVGKRFRRMGQEARVMAAAEGYAMMRFKGCSPFVEYVKDLPKTFFLVDAKPTRLTISDLSTGRAAAPTPPTTSGQSAGSATRSGLTSGMAKRLPTRKPRC